MLTIMHYSIYASQAARKTFVFRRIDFLFVSLCSSCQGFDTKHEEERYEVPCSLTNYGKYCTSSTIVVCPIAAKHSTRN